MNDSRSIRGPLLLLAGLGLPTPGLAQIAQIIDASGDGAGNSLGGAWGLAASRSGDAFVCGRSTHNAFRVPRAGAVTEVLDGSGGGTGVPLVAPRDVAVSCDGAVYVLAADGAFEIAPNGNVEHIIDASGDGAGHPLAGAERIAVDDDDNVYVTGRASHNAFRIAPDGTISQILDASGDGAGNPLSEPVGIAVDAEGNVFVAGYGSDNLFRVSPAGMVTLLVDSSGDGQGHLLSGAHGVTVDRWGNAYVTGLESDNAFQVTPAGSIRQVVDGAGDGIGNPLEEPWDVVVDDAARIFVSGHASENVLEITAGGEITERIDATGDGQGNTLGEPRSLAVDATGLVFVSGLDNAFRLDKHGPPLGTVYCRGNGSAGACPCGNETTGGGCANSTGQGAALGARGRALVGLDSVVLSATRCPPMVPGLFFSGGGSHGGIPFGDGLQCTSGPFLRLQVDYANANGVAETCVVLSEREGLVGGDVRYYQYWYRDNQGPCSGGFNTSSGLSIEWAVAPGPLYEESSRTFDAYLQGAAPPNVSKEIYTVQDFPNQIFVRNPDCWASAIDLTGISPWNQANGPQRAGTLVSPRHVVFAKHYPLSTTPGNNQIVFVTEQNVVVTRELLAVTYPAADIGVGVLDADVPPEIAFYPVLPQDWHEHLWETDRLPMLHLDQQEKALVRDMGELQPGGPTCFHKTPVSPLRAPFSEDLIGGDSGNPAFVLIGGQAALVLTHHTATTGPFYTTYFNAVNAAMSQLGGGYQLTPLDLSSFPTE